VKRPLAALVARLRATRRVWRRGGAYLVLLEPGTPAGGRAGRGSLDHCGPETSADAELGVITVRGWALLPSGPAARVELFLGDAPLGPARIGIRRPDVAQATGDPLGVAAGYQHVLDAASLPVGSEGRPVRAIAIGVRGERLELAPRPLTLHGAAGAAEDGGDPRPRARPRLRSAGAPGRRLLAVTHQLDLGGAQLYLVDLLRALKAASPCSCTVLSPKDGPLRADLEPLGIEVHVSGRMDFDDPVAYDGRVEELTGWIAAQHFDVALMNTALTFAGADAAGRAGLPVVWAIHESYEPRVLWSTFGEGLHRDVRGRAEAVLADAAAVLFEADATRRQYAEYVAPERALTLPYGLDLDQVAAARDGFDRRAARRRLGIPNRAVVALCVGTIEPRKAQLVLAQAFAAVADRHPDAMLVFVGARDDPNSDALEAIVAACGPPGRVEVLPISRDVSSWYGVSDVLVCASDVESLPRTVLEAMAWELPVLATAVFGLPDLIEHGRTGWLCAPRDLGALAEGLDAVLAAGPDERRRAARAARAVVAEHHAIEPYAARCAEILWGAAAAAMASSGR
jgi:D-inositol-3-phosphate glycosyltransferase